MQELTELRHLLHAHPELSGKEALTNKILNEWVRQTRPDLVIEHIGGFGLAAVYRGNGKRNGEALNEAKRVKTGFDSRGY